MRNAADFPQWREAYASKLKSVLRLRGSPVAVAYSHEPAGNASQERYRACGATPSARDGAVINLSRASCACRGGVDHLGLGPPAGGLEELLRCGFLVYGEKLWGSVSAARQATRHTASKAPPPRGLGEYIIFSPLEKAQIEPDLVLFLCNPEQACRLIALARYRDGVLPPIELEGSLCWSTITYPLVTGNINVSLGDAAARRIEGWAPDELVVSVPAAKLHQMVESIEACTAGSASPAFRLAQSPARAKHRGKEEGGSGPPAWADAPERAQ